jgi:hypothetical protein
MISKLTWTASRDWRCKKRRGGVSGPPVAAPPRLQGGKAQKMEAPKRQGHAMGQPQKQPPAAPLLRVAKCKAAKSCDLVASILASRAVTGEQRKMCDGGRVGANQRRASDSRSRLTAWLATGVPCAQPGRDVDRRTLFRPVASQICPGLCAQWAELLEGALAAALDFRGWGVGGEERGGEGRRIGEGKTVGPQDSRTAGPQRGGQQQRQPQDLLGRQLP